jgi:hypothetical protein
MARAVVKCVFATLLALLSTQVVAPSVRVVTAIEIVCSAEVEQQTPKATRLGQADVPVRQPVPAYVSRTRPEPDNAVPFQRPPPRPSFFS